MIPAPTSGKRGRRRWILTEDAALWCAYHHLRRRHVWYVTTWLSVGSALVPLWADVERDTARDLLEALAATRGE
jgi:hypothetical protein